MRFSNILFIAPIFHQYHEKIIQALKAAGANVDFYPERNYGLKFKLLNNISQNLLTEHQCKYYRNILKKISTSNIEYDCLFVIRGFMMPAEFLIKFKTLFPKAKLLMYQWDSNRTNRFSHLVQYFDKVLSFDFKDSDDFSLEYLPLFYTQDLIPYKKESPKVYDFFFMGTYLPERYNALVKFKEKYENNYNIKSFIYIGILVAIFFGTVSFTKFYFYDSDYSVKSTELDAVAIDNIKLGMNISSIDLSKYTPIDTNVDECNYNFEELSIKTNTKGIIEYIVANFSDIELYVGQEDTGERMKKVNEVWNVLGGNYKNENYKPKENNYWKISKYIDNEDDIYFGVVFSRYNNEMSKVILSSKRITNN